MSESALYTGEVWHSRRVPRRRDFRYPVYLFYLDLDELATEELFGGSRLFSARRPAPARFRRGDFLGDPTRPLDECARDLVERETGDRPEGAVRLLANVRSFGYQFNPIAVYYLFDREDRLEYVVADVTNIPWRESEPYVFEARDGVASGTARKRMHVSPFLGMDYTYELIAREPGETLSLSVSNSRDDAVEFAAGLTLERAGSTASVLRRTLARFPAMALQVTGRIFWQALKLRASGHAWHEHPPRSAADGDHVEPQTGEIERVPISG